MTRTAYACAAADRSVYTPDRRENSLETYVTDGRENRPQALLYRMANQKSDSKSRDWTIG